MPITLKCYANCDDVFLVWHPDGHADGAIPGCLGFCVEVKKPDGSIEVLHNLRGFAADQPRTGETRPTDTWPLQTYTWTDHTILAGSSVQFRVTAMTGQPGKLQRGETSDWSELQTLSPRAGSHTSAFFNRGMILSQFVSRYAKEHQLTTAKALKANLKSDVDSPLMQFLSGELGKAIRGILKGARDNPNLEVYCALFELDLDDLIDGLAALGGRAHVVLGNGSAKSVDDDVNAAAAARLEGRVDLHRRMSAPKGLAHNKFVVVCDKGKPFGVWTGSTNWSMTGLHTQINNGIAVVDNTLAQWYLDHWKALRDAGDAFPASLTAPNTQARGPAPINSQGRARVWFTPMASGKDAKNGGADIDDLTRLVDAAQEGILFVMFMPGQEPLGSILKRQEGGLYARGVVSTLPMGTQDKRTNTYQLMTGQGYKPYKLDVVQPQGATAIGDFLDEFSRQDFLQGMGFAITHSKVIVIDPFGAKPVVITGSHNLSASASKKNDENLLVIENCPELARAYAVNCMSVYQHYRFPAAQHDSAKLRQQGKDAHAGFLRVDDGWQTKLKNPDTIADMKFWG